MKHIKIMKMAKNRSNNYKNLIGKVKLFHLIFMCLYTVHSYNDTNQLLRLSVIGLRNSSLETQSRQPVQGNMVTQAYS